MDTAEDLTRAHRRALEMVRGQRVMWRAADTPVGTTPQLLRPEGFADHHGGRLKPSALIALWDSLTSDLIVVDGVVVSLSREGRAQLSGGGL